MAKDHDDKDYEVGYGRPPKAHQFKPGQSGNPKGRPPDKRFLKLVLREVLTEDIELTENGRTITVSKQEALMRKLVAEALKGNRDAYRMVIEITGSHPQRFESHGY